MQRLNLMTRLTLLSYFWGLYKLSIITRNSKFNDGINYDRSVFKLLYELWAHINLRRRLQLMAVAILMFISTILELISIGSVLPFLTALSMPEKLFANPQIESIIIFMGISSPDQLLLPFTFIFCLGALFSGAIRLLLLWGQNKLSFAIGADLGLEAYRRTLYQPYLVHISRNSAEVVSGIMNKVGGLVFIAILPVLNLISSFLLLISVVALLLTLDPLVTLFTIAVFFGVYVCISILIRQDLILSGARVTIEQNNVLKAMNEGLGGIRDILIDGTQELFVRIFRNYDRPMRQASAKIAIYGGAPRYIVETAGMLVIACVAYLIVKRSGGAVEAIPMLGVIAIGAQRILPLMQQIYNCITSLWGGRALLADALHLLSQPVSKERYSDIETKQIFRESVSFKNVSFRYSQQGAWILKNISFEILRGQRIGIVGVTGSGKSTLIDILMGLLPPTKGCLCIDGVVVEESLQKTWQRRVAHVPQSIYLADTSIAENIAFGIPLDQLDMKRVQVAAIKAQIASTIEKLPDKFRTRIGERGVRLSGGQRQRIGIARALYKQAEIIVLDEATSALDDKTEQEVMSEIDDLSRDITIIMVAHRLSSLKKCDLIIKIEDGSILETGNIKDFN